MLLLFTFEFLITTNFECRWSMVGRSTIRLYHECEGGIEK